MWLIVKWRVNGQLDFVYDGPFLIRVVHRISLFRQMRLHSIGLIVFLHFFNLYGLGRALN